jgi:hypothetical protein
VTLTPTSGPAEAGALVDRAAPSTRERARAAGDLAIAHLAVVDGLALRYRRAARDPGSLREGARLGLAKAIHFYCGERGLALTPAPRRISVTG